MRRATRDRGPIAFLAIAGKVPGPFGYGNGLQYYFPLA